MTPSQSPGHAVIRAARRRPAAGHEVPWLIVVADLFQAHLLLTVTSRDLAAMLTDWRARCPGPDGQLPPAYWNPRATLPMEGQALVGPVGLIDATMRTGTPLVRNALRASRRRRRHGAERADSGVVVRRDAAWDAALQRLAQAGCETSALWAQCRDAFVVTVALPDTTAETWVSHDFHPIVVSVTPYLVMEGAEATDDARARVFWADIARLTVVQPAWAAAVVADPRVAPAWAHLARDDAAVLLAHPLEEVRALAISRLHGVRSSLVVGTAGPPLRRPRPARGRPQV